MKLKNANTIIEKESGCHHTVDYQCNYCPKCGESTQGLQSIMNTVEKHPNNNLLLRCISWQKDVKITIERHDNSNVARPKKEVFTYSNGNLSKQRFVLQFKFERLQRVSFSFCKGNSEIIVIVTDKNASGCSHEVNNDFCCTCGANVNQSLLQVKRIASIARSKKNMYEFEELIEFYAREYRELKFWYIYDIWLKSYSAQDRYWGFGWKDWCPEN